MKGSSVTFQDRNAQWKGEKREFIQLASRSTSPRIWTVWAIDDTLYCKWGQLGGAMQEVNEKAPVVNAGKKNEVSANANALALGLRKMELKYREGYREVQVSAFIHDTMEYTTLDPIEAPAIDFTKPLPQSLAFYKPLNAAGAGLLKKAENGDAWYTRKMNGMMHVIVSDAQGAIQIYSRRMLRQHDDEAGTNLTWNDRFPYVVEAASVLMPPNSILLGEMIVQGPNGLEDFKAIQSVTKSLSMESRSKQHELLHGEGKFVTFIIWDIAFWNGEDFVSKQPVRARLDLIHELDYQGTALGPVQIFTADHFPTTDAALTIAKHHGWEGFVLVDPDGVYGDKAFNFKGKPDRPGSFCAKLKPSFEDDFIAIWNPASGQGEFSTKGRYGGNGIKCVALFQYNSAGELVYISNLNSGMTEQMKTEMADVKLWPRVWRVEYKERTYISEGDDTNALTFAAFIEERTDKSPQECVNPQL
jgi:ATP-dependent DNA ligase